MIWQPLSVLTTASGCCFFPFALFYRYFPRVGNHSTGAGKHAALGDSVATMELIDRIQQAGNQRLLRSAAETEA